MSFAWRQAKSVMVLAGTFWFEQEIDLEKDEASPATATADDGLDFQ